MNFQLSHFQLLTLNSQFIIFWPLLSEDIFTVFEIDFAEYMLESVADDEVGYTKLHVVGGYLVEYVLCDGYVGTFIFYDY